MDQTRAKSKRSFKNDRPPKIQPESIEASLAAIAAAIVELTDAVKNIDHTLRNPEGD